MLEYKTNNFFDYLPHEVPEEIFECLIDSKSIKIEKIISKGQITADNAYYNQDRNEWLILLQGEAIISFKEPLKEISMNVGDYLLIPAHQLHRVEWTPTDKITLWLAIHF